ncbi:MAG: amino acid permease, partial [Desulfovibrio sp.]|nr:amino acid permease [Desulfovibrio sp.]
MPAPQKKVAISTMALMTVGTVVSLNALPMMAAEGLSLIFYISFATFVFLLPAAMVSAELGSAFASQKGGVYTWVKAAFGPRWGFVAIWMQWVQTLAWYPTILGFSAASLAYCLGDPHLAKSGLYTGMVSISIYACATAVALSGTDAVNTLTKYSVLIGTLVPSLFIIVLGLLWVDQGNGVAFLEQAVQVD